MAAALCQLCTSRHATCIKAVWLAEPRQGRADPAALAVTRCEGRRIGIMVTAKNTVTEAGGCDRRQ